MQVTVTIRETKVNGRTWVSTHEAADAETAFRAALVRHWGKKAGWFPNRELNEGVDTSWNRFGQIGHPIGNGQTCSMDTGAVAVELRY